MIEIIPAEPDPEDAAAEENIPEEPITAELMDSPDGAAIMVSLPDPILIAHADTTDSSDAAPSASVLIDADQLHSLIERLQALEELILPKPSTQLFVLPPHPVSIRPMTPALGMTVLYQLCELDAEHINRRRNDYTRHCRTTKETPGFIAHVGRWAEGGMVFPALITGIQNGTVDLHVLLNGNDSLWVIDSPQGDEPGQWSFPTETFPDLPTWSPTPND